MTLKISIVMQTNDVRKSTTLIALLTSWKTTVEIGYVRDISVISAVPQVFDLFVNSVQ